MILVKAEQVVAKGLLSNDTPREVTHPVFDEVYKKAKVNTLSRGQALAFYL